MNIADVNTIDSYAVVAIVGVLGSCVAGLLWVIKFIFQKLLPAFEKQAKVTNKLVVATASNTKATKAADEYLRQRNGRDIEKHEELLEVTKAIPVKMQEIADIQAKALIDNLKKLPAQNIQHQHVKDQTVENSKEKK